MNAKLSRWLVVLAMAIGSPLWATGQQVAPDATDANDATATTAPSAQTSAQQAAAAQQAAPGTAQAPPQEERAMPRSAAERERDGDRAAAAARTDRRPMADQYAAPLPPPRGYGYYDEPEYRSAGYGGGAAYGYPSRAVNAVPPAQARATAAYLQYQRALDELDSAIESAQRRFNQSEPMRRTAAAERRAWGEYEAARSQALDKLDDDADYQALRSLKQDLDEKISAERRTRRPNLMRIVALAQTKLNYATQATQQEQAALGQAGNIQQAKQRFVQAAGQTQELRQRFNRELPDLPQVAQARDRVAETRIAYQAAEAYLDGLLEARDIALDYAYDVGDDLDYAWGHYPPYYRNFPAWWLGQ